MKSLFNFFKKKRKRNVTAIDNLFEDSFFNNINYPILITLQVYVIYRDDAISKFYALDLSIIDMDADVYEDQVVQLIEKHIKKRIYNENYSYIYHLQNLNNHETIQYVNLEIDDMFLKVFTKAILNNKDLKEYLELVLFGPSEPFIENIEDLDKV